MSGRGTSNGFGEEIPVDPEHHNLIASKPTTEVKLCVGNCWRLSSLHLQGLVVMTLTDL